MRIGVFDSGFGGLTVLQALWEYYPGHDYVYIADTANAPYGDRSPEEVGRLTHQWMDWLAEEAGCPWSVAACNTATVHCGERMCGGVIEPTVLAALEQIQGRVGVLATRATVTSGEYVRVFAKHAPQREVCTIAAPGLVPLVEQGSWQREEAIALVKEYVAALGSVEGVVLGCTHYPLLREVVEEVVGANMPIIESGTAVAKYYEHMLATTQSLTGTVQYYTTGDPTVFEDRARVLLAEHWLSGKVHGL